MAKSCTRRGNPEGCHHLANYRARHGPEVLKALSKCLRIRPPGGATLRRDPHDVPACITCGKNQGRLYACLVCATVACWRPPDFLHASQHANAHPGHDIAVDVDRAELFCCACNDQVYDSDFDTAVLFALAAVRGDGSGGRLEPNGNGNGNGNGRNKRRRRLVEYKPWTPTAREKSLLVRGSSSLGEGSGSCLPWGLRGLNNLGNTCFMNSVLQALLHTPPLRNYFLSDRHNRYVCQKNAQRLCLACDMDAMFSAAFSGDRTPYSPAQFLYSWWQHAANLASYEQQDAHEFFISMLDGVHANDGREHSTPKGSGESCCIAHRVFSGILRSDVTCTVCGFTSTTYDPCVDISLDLEPNHGFEKMLADSYSCNGDLGHTGVSSQSLGISTLLGCLDRFTRPERLGSDQKFYCQHCQVPQESIKQMSMRRLPLVLCFHIKRFEHSSTRNTSRKVDRYLQFPLFLDMAPYMSSSIVRNRHGNRIFALNGEDSDVASTSDLSSEYELFAVVTHTGKLDAGHYVSYLRLSNQWYKCDDAWVSQVSERVVRASQGYMMYYVQKMLYYKASEDLAGQGFIDKKDSELNHGNVTCQSMANGI